MSSAPAAAVPRPLTIRDWPDAFAEVERLRRGCRPLRSMDLAQTCEHLAFFIEGATDGATYKVPWIFRVLFGKAALKRILADKKMKLGAPTAKESLPPKGGDESAAVARFKRAAERFAAHQGEYHPSPFFGRLTRDQWRTLMLLHAAHHLGLLAPN